MRQILLSFFALVITIPTLAQNWVTDESMEETVMLEDNQLKVLYFTASWCGPCRYMKPIMQDIDEDETVDTTVYFMDTDSNIADDILKVNSIPAYFFIKNGRVLGRTGSAVKREDMVDMIERHDDMTIVGNLLAYRGKPSKHELIAGANPKLTVENLETIWYDAHQLNALSWKIYQKLTDPQDIACALILIQRSIELEEFTSNLETYAHLLAKNGENRKALKMAKKAKRKAEKNNEFTGIIEELITKLEA
ncbi:thioredoxin family protein [Nonlabens ulvanivorans]|uniref:Thioredoxin n=1 Tax=Nonlabens ulvanivorans TaxID=906888 RepID=A0A084JVP0_NONUL|nr:thioredoxin family protein [Nonlabens ulvanivorans]KEZ93024.1 thioredoxin [Nonlabens ulvanivorans]PRX12746.1 thioredoxin 1 [Nonlabens ulvanivorans]